MERLNTITARAFSPDDVYINACGPPDGTFINKQSGGVISCWQEWVNDNTEGHAFVRGQVTLNGEVVPVEVNTEHEYRRQVDDTTYEVLIGPEASHSIPFAIDITNIPTGDAVQFGGTTKLVDQRGLAGF